jgi:beta-carotene 3-hydroxylase
MTGLMFNDFRLYTGIGISLYGLAYFFIHEIVIHQRFKLFRNWKNKYILGIRRAHKIHHKHLGKEEGENFGMLVVPFRYFKHDSKKIIE